MPVVGDGAQHLGEPRLAVEVAPVAVHVLAEQRDLDDTVSDEARDLGDDVLQRARPLAAAHVRHDAVACRSCRSPR